MEVEKKNIADERNAISRDLKAMTAHVEQMTAEQHTDMLQVSRVYEAMKPARVATIFQELEPAIVAELLQQMKERNSAKILGEMGTKDAARAAQISKLMQGQETNDAKGKVAAQ